MTLGTRRTFSYVGIAVACAIALMVAAVVFLPEYTVVPLQQEVVSRILHAAS